MLSAVAALPPRRGAVVVLRFCGDMTEAAIAENLGISVGTVNHSCHMRWSNFAPSSEVRSSHDGPTDRGPHCGRPGGPRARGIGSRRALPAPEPARVAQRSAALRRARTRRHGVVAGVAFLAIAGGGVTLRATNREPATDVLTTDAVPADNANEFQRTIDDIVGKRNPPPSTWATRTPGGVRCRPTLEAPC